jgi:hypothetical protein
VDIVFAGHIHAYERSVLILIRPAQETQLWWFKIVICIEV